ncbi:G protein signaling domain, partial [Rhizoctonia solani]
MYGARLSRWAGRRATRKLIKDVRLVNILSGDACSPLGLEEFEAYVALQEHSLENLQFIIWYHDYQQRFFSLDTQEQALSPSLAKYEAHLALPAPNTKTPIPNSPRSSGWALSPISSSPTTTSWSSWSPISVPSPIAVPLKDQPFRNEILQIVATFIRPGAKKELNLDMDVREELLRGLEKSTHPDIFARAYAQIYDLVDGCSVPNFVTYAAANINLPKQIYWTNRYAIGIVFTLISWIIAIFTICFIPDQPRSKRSIRLVSVPFAVLGCMQIYSAWRGFCSQVFGRSARQLRAWELVDPADAGVSFQITDPVPSLPPKPPPLRTVLDMAAGTKKHVVAPFVNLPSTSSLEMVSMTPTIGSPSPSGPRIVFTDPEPRGRGGGRAAFRRPAVYGPERVVEDPRIREFHQGVIRDMLWVGFGWGLAWTGIVVGIPGRG